MRDGRRRGGRLEARDSQRWAGGCAAAAAQARAEVPQRRRRDGRVHGQRDGELPKRIQPRRPWRGTGRGGSVKKIG